MLRPRCPLSELIQSIAVAGSDDLSDAERKRKVASLALDHTASDPGNDFSRPAPETDLARGHPVGEYVIEEVIGRGGFGIVYRAVQPLIGKRVAIKVLSRMFSADREMVSRFVAEARAVNQIRHRNIIDIFSFGRLSDGRQYYVMEHLEGEGLDRYLANHGPLQVAVALPILRAVARALDAAHAKGVAHRDLKPENVYLTRDDDGVLFPKLLDFGIAKLSGDDDRVAHKTNTGIPIGTPYYMSPEQCRGVGVDHRTDIYSFGALAYRLLTGAFPFDGAIVDIMHDQVYCEPTPPSRKNPLLGPTVDAAIAWMMRKDPNERPSTAIAAVVALGGDASLTPFLTTGLDLPPPRRSHRRWGVAAAVVVVAAVVAAAVAINQRRDEANPAPPGIATVPGPPPLAPPAASPRDAAAVVVDAVTQPKHVMVTVTGAPEGTEVLIGGTVRGAAPGDVQLDRGDDSVVLTFRADGYISQSKPVVPSQNQTLKLTLKPKRSAPPTRPGPSEPNGDDLIHLFGKDNGR